MYNFPISPAAGTLYAPAGGPSWRFLDGAWQQETEVDPPLIGAAYYDSVAQAAASTISGSLNAIQVLGYYAAGDGGGALYKRVGVAPTHAGKIHSADGAWWELAEVTPNCLMFGAKRDGVTDDAPAINAMIAYLPTVSGSGWHRTTEALIPLGDYRIGSTITTNKTTTRLIGKGAHLSPHASFNLANFAMDLELWDGLVEGFTFDGFTNGLSVHNPNTNEGMVELRDLFFRAGAEAMRIECQSTKVVIDNVKCDGSIVALNIIAGDMVDWRSGWIKQGVLTTDYTATIENHGILLLGAIVGVPTTQTKVGTAWINNHYTVRAHRMRFGGEGGSATIVNNFAEGDITSPLVPRGVLLESCTVYSTNEVVRLYKLPNFVTVKDCEGFVGSLYTVLFDEHFVTLASEVTRIDTCFSIKLDNVPEGDSLMLGNGITLLPYLQLEGFSVNRTGTLSSVVSEPVKFFGNRDSSNHYPFRARATYIIHLSQNTAGAVDSYSSYHVKAVDSGGAVAGTVVTAIRAPTTSNAGVVFVDTDNILKIKTNGGASSSFFYRIDKIGPHGWHGIG
jgi:hypothetical protein